MVREDYGERYKGAESYEMFERAFGETVYICRRISNHGAQIYVSLELLQNVLRKGRLKASRNRFKLIHKSNFAWSYFIYLNHNR